MTRIPKLFPGDVFCVASNSWISKSIMWAENLQSKDGRVDYSHAGIITHSDGTTFEAGWHVGYGHLDCYINKKVLIARPLSSLFTNKPIGEKLKKEKIDSIVRKHLNNSYPWWRIPLHFFPLLKRAGNKNHVVCSELVAEYLFLIGARYTRYLGVNPDTLADEWKVWANFTVLFEEIWGLEKQG